ncbi:hypothetical protein [Streptomyces sp. AK02-01A]|uniref:hypothetical protein n=1 Tax=Streptomyces sp. AK02-01A TaxID=3028648 RepID=UPI0029BCE1BC|nr:hypothetical protein [Streptomyces sp. AK02-01A]MDX3853910.1 hypothetical protein [Streptomyces sp. AK02-01A]
MVADSAACQDTPSQGAVLAQPTRPHQSSHALRTTSAAVLGLTALSLPNYSNRPGCPPQQTKLLVCLKVVVVS